MSETCPTCGSGHPAVWRYVNRDGFPITGSGGDYEGGSLCQDAWHQPVTDTTSAGDEVELPVGTCACGCGARTNPARQTDRARGYVKGQPMPTIHGHTFRIRQQASSVEERFWAKVDKEGGGCWIWLGAKSLQGYGTFTLQGRTVRAHRYAYELTGQRIPDGLVIDHACRNRACVNPDHMEPVTNRENVLRGVGFAAANATRTECPQGHPYDLENTYRDRNGGRSCRTCRRDRSRKASA